MKITDSGKLPCISNYLANSQVKCSIEKIGFGNSLCLSGRTRLFAGKNIDCGKSLLKDHFQIFRTFIRNYSDFLEIYPIKSEIKGSMKKLVARTVPAEAAALAVMLFLGIIGFLKIFRSSQLFKQRHN